MHEISKANNVSRDWMELVENNPENCMDLVCVGFHSCFPLKEPFFLETHPGQPVHILKIIQKSALHYNHELKCLSIIHSIILSFFRLVHKARRKIAAALKYLLIKVNATLQLVGGPWEINRLLEGIAGMSTACIPESLKCFSWIQHRPISMCFLGNYRDCSAFPETSPQNSALALP